MISKNASQEKDEEKTDEDTIEKANYDFNLWLVLPFHPLIEKGLSVFIEQINCDAEIRRYLCSAFNCINPNLCISWKNQLPNLERYISAGGRER